MSQLAATLLSLFVTVVLGTGANAGMLEIKGKHPATVQPKPGLAGQVCDRNILGLDRSGKYGMPSQALSVSDPLVLRVLAIRVNFTKETTDDPQTTGDGTLDMRTKAEYKAQEGHLIDPAPHDKDYFAAHMRALAEYFRVVSNGRLQLVYDVYPQAKDAAYQLDKSMANYGLQTPAAGLGQFVFDALHAADADSSLALYDTEKALPVYDCYIVFHAGSDQQNNLPGFGIDTPGDLYTGYIKMGDASFQVDNNRVLISDAVIMPESPSQDGRVTALNAVMGHEFGHQLGLIDLYDTRTGMTQVGDFSLMDYNGFGVNIDLGETVPVLVQGVMPIFPDAWSRAYLGFVDVDVVTAANNHRVIAAETEADSDQVLLVPINADEYFLVENRRTDIDNKDSDGPGLRTDSLTDVILWPRSSTSNANNREYDYLIPGSGMMIWHVDELVARLDYNQNGVSNFDENQLQLWNFASDTFKWDNHHRFLSIVEADGIVDFGGYYYAGYGKQADLFDINNNDELGPTTNPPSTSNSSAYTGITINDISAALAIMTCDVKIEGRLAGWPNQVFANSVPLVAADLNKDNKDEILTASGPFLLAYKLDGSPLFTPDSGKGIAVARDVMYGSGIELDTLAVMGEINRTDHFVKNLAVGDINGDGFAEVVGVTSANTLLAFTTATLSYQGQAIKLFEKTLDTTAAIAPMILDYDKTNTGLEILVCNDRGYRLIFDKDGNRIVDKLSERPFRVMSDSLHRFELMSPQGGLAPNESGTSIGGAAAADFDGNGTIEMAEVYGNTLHLGYAGNNRFPNVGGEISSEIALGDLEGDGYLEIVFCGDNLIYAYNQNGTPVSNFPITVNKANPAGPIKGSPVLADINGDGKMEIFVGTQTGEVAGFDLNGDRLDQFPKSVGGTVTFSLVLARNGSTAALLALSDEGMIHAFTIPAPAKVEWGGPYAGPKNLGSYVRTLDTPTPIAEAIGYMYNYPNPAASETRVRFTVRESGRVTFKFYNVAGDVVDEGYANALAGVDNEWPYDCTQLASGVYYCQMETASGDRKHCTVAVVR